MKLRELFEDIPVPTPRPGAPIPVPQPRGDAPPRAPQSGEITITGPEGSGFEPQTTDTGLQQGPPYPPEDEAMVKSMQTRLQELGYSVGYTGIDGKYGFRTAAAVDAFKKDNKISGDGSRMSVAELDKLKTAKAVENPSPTANSLSRGSTTGSAKPTDDMLTMIKNFEGFYPKAYWDYKQYSIGYGSKATGPNQTITEPEAVELLKQEVKTYIRNVEYWNEKGGYNWNDGQKAALVSFAYNIGSINQLTANGTRDNATIARKIPEYRKAGGKVLRGLVKRRAVERDKFVMHTPELAGTAR